MRIVVDGTLGAGKTTFLTGTSPSWGSRSKFPNVRDLGYRVFSELIRGTVDERRKFGADPFDDWGAFFALAQCRAEEQYADGAGEEISFYDRGLPFLGVMASRYGYRMPDAYFRSTANHQYDSPVLIFEPIIETDYTHPRQGEVRASIFTLEERLQQHADTIAAYEQLNYEIVRIPVFKGTMEESIQRRFEFVRDLLGL